MGVEFSYDGSALRDELLQDMSSLSTLGDTPSVYDYVALHWFHRLPGALEACWNALRDGGVLIVSFPYEAFDGDYYNDSDCGWSIDHALQRVAMVCDKSRTSWKMRRSGVQDALPGAFLVLEKVPLDAGPLVTSSELDRIDAGGGSLCIVRDGHLGDLLIITGVIKELSSRYPNIGIHVRCDEPYFDVFLMNDDVDSIDTIPGSPTDIDCDKIVNLRRYVEDGADAWTKERSAIFAKAFDMELDDGRPIYELNQDDRPLALQLLGRLGIDPYESPFVVIAPDASDPRRGLSGETLDAIRDRLESVRMKYVVLGSDRGEDGFDISLSAWALALSGSLIAADNGMYHLAEGIVDVDIHSQVVFSVVDPNLRLRWYKHVTPHVPRVPCSPCNESPRDGCLWECVSPDAIDIDLIVDSACDAARASVPHHD